MTIDDAPNDPVDLRIRPFGLTWLVLRVAAVLAILWIGLAGLEYLRFSERASAGHLLVDLGRWDDARRIAFAYLPELIGVTLMVEGLLYLTALSGRSWWWCQLLPPIVAALAGILFGLVQFTAEEPPKLTMLIIGTCLLAYLAASIQLAFWQTIHAPQKLMVDFPPVWYALALMLGAAFFGALDAWTAGEPQLRRLLQYRTQAWGPHDEHPPLEFPESDDFVIP